MGYLVLLLLPFTIIFINISNKLRYNILIGLMLLFSLLYLINSLDYWVKILSINLNFFKYIFLIFLCLLLIVFIHVNFIKEIKILGIIILLGYGLNYWLGIYYNNNLITEKGNNYIIITPVYRFRDFTGSGIGQKPYKLLKSKNFLFYKEVPFHIKLDENGYITDEESNLDLKIVGDKIEIVGPSKTNYDGWEQR